MGLDRVIVTTSATAAASGGQQLQGLDQPFGAIGTDAAAHLHTRHHGGGMASRDGGEAVQAGEVLIGELHADRVRQLLALGAPLSRRSAGGAQARSGASHGPAVTTGAQVGTEIALAR